MISKLLEKWRDAINICFRARYVMNRFLYLFHSAQNPTQATYGVKMEHQSVLNGIYPSFPLLVETKYL